MSSSLNAEHFPGNCQPFTALKLVSGKTAWISPDFCFPPKVEGRARTAEDVFFETYGYMIEGGQLFDNLVFDRSRSAEFKAERYGGRGIGDNGGGVRCGILGGHQVKGLGKNVLVGAGADVHHSYGGFKALYAVHEAIFSKVYRKIMPFGAADVYGVILTGPDAAYHSKLQRGWGALLVREDVLRPAGFIRAPHYRQRVAGMTSDVARVRRANKELLKYCGGVGGYTQFLGRFLANCANQFAFGRIARIMHGSLTPSNLCMDGRWLDLTNSGFVGSAENNAGGNRQTSSFYEEMHFPLRVTAEMMHTFAKYNGVSLNPAPLIDFYNKELGMRLKSHLCYLFGWTYELYREELDADFSRLSQTVMRILSSGKVAYDRWPEHLGADDPVLIFLERMYCARDHAEDTAAGTGAVGDQERAAFDVLMHAAYLTRSRIGESFDSFFIASFLLAFKRCAYSEFFFKTRLERQISPMLVDDLKAEDIRDFIDGCLGISEWVFGEPVESATITLFRSKAIEIRYDRSHQSFSIIKTDSTKTLRSAPDALAAIARECAANSGAFILYGYDFAKFLIRMMSGIPPTGAKQRAYA